MKGVVIYLACALLIVSGAHGGIFREDFSTHRPRWHLESGGVGKVSIADGRLVLDLSTAKRGKWAFAELHIAITLPARIEWEQCLAHDSRYTWFCGVHLWSARRRAHEWLIAGLGGGGLKNCFFLAGERSPEGMVKVGQWYRFVLDVHKERQTLTVFARGSVAPLIQLQSHRALPHSPFFLRFFQNSHRLRKCSPDGYDQDRGTTWIDNVVLTAQKLEVRKPPKPIVTNPYKVPIVFNRAMRWLTKEDGLLRACIAYEAVGWLALTGKRCVSHWVQLRAWHEQDLMQLRYEPNIKHDDELRTTFTLPAKVNEATFAIRALQFNTEQHPILQWEGIVNGRLEWQIEVTATDGIHPFMWRIWASEWFDDKASGKVNIARAYHRSGRPNRYAEVDVLLHLRRRAPGDANLRLRLGMPGRVAIVPRTPIVSTIAQAKRSGIAISAIVVDERGRIVTDPAVELNATILGHKFTLQLVNENGIRRGVVRNLPAGEHAITLTATNDIGHVIAKTTTNVIVTTMEFLTHYNHEKRSYCTASGEALGPLLGDLFAWVPFADLRSDRRQLILGLNEFRHLVQQQKRSFGYTKWRSLPRRFIDTYLDYMARSGVRIIRITPNVSPLEYYLDVAGHLAPHGLEQLSYILNAARRNGIRVLINLFHYPYLNPATGNVPPVWQYFEAGYRKQWHWVSERMWRYLSNYLDELLGFTGADPCVLGYTVMGENDQNLPAQWLNRAYKFIKARAPNQMVVLEQGGSIFRCRERDPRSYADYKPTSDGGVGFRTYSTYRHPTDCFMAVAMRFYNMARPSYLGEVACGIRTSEGFITKYRDAMGLALTLQLPVAIAWSAALVEGQCKAFTKAAQLIDWTSFRRARPPVAIIVHKPDAEQVARLVRYEEMLSAIPIDYEYIRPDEPRAIYEAIFDAREEFLAPMVKRTLSQIAAEKTPLRLSAGNHCSYAFSEDGRWLVAYIRNALHYELGLCDIRAVEKYRLADREREVTIELRNMRGHLRYQVWDASTAKTLREGTFRKAHKIQLRTVADLLIVVTPAGL